MHCGLLPTFPFPIKDLTSGQQGGSAASVSGLASSPATALSKGSSLTQGKSPSQE